MPFTEMSLVKAVNWTVRTYSFINFAKITLPFAGGQPARKRQQGVERQNTTSPARKGHSSFPNKKTPAKVCRSSGN